MKDGDFVFIFVKLINLMIDSTTNSYIAYVSLMNLRISFVCSFAKTIRETLSELIKLKTSKICGTFGQFLSLPSHY